MKAFDVGLADGLVKTAASGPHVDAAVRELRARGHDRLALAGYGAYQTLTPKRYDDDRV